MKTLTSIPLGGYFSDLNGCIFRKVAKVEGKRKFQIECVTSPFQKVGEISGAFFCAVGDVVYREGALEVHPVLPEVHS